MENLRAANEAAIRAYCDAWTKGDLAALIDCYADDIVLHYFGRSPFAGDHRGKSAALAVLAELQRRTNRRLVAIHDVLVSDHHAIVMAQEQFERDGRVLDLNRILVYHIRDGKLAEAWLYDEDQRAVDAFWG